MSFTEDQINLVVIGHGKLAKEIGSTLAELDLENGSIKSIQNYDGVNTFPALSVLIHVGSGRQYQESLDLALKEKYVFIQAATEKDFPLLAPESNDIVFINAPNLDLRLIKLFYWLKLGSSLFKDEKITITESHQATKTSVPGTAYKICDLLGIDYSKVTSIRDPDQQSKLQIKTLEQHAYHQLILGTEESHLKIETKIEGGRSYAEGLYKMLKSIHKIPVGKYDVEELLINGYL